jgi:hypothetical protein
LVPAAETGRISWGEGPGDICGYSGEIDHHSALKPITIPEESDQASERSDAGFSIFPEGDRFRQV